MFSISKISWLLGLAVSFSLSGTVSAQNSTDFTKSLQPFLEKHCYECHDDLTAKGDLDLFELKSDLSQPADMEIWMQIFDRVAAGEMPPKEEDRPMQKHLTSFLRTLEEPLVAKHDELKGTVLRRLNRIEYQNTLNDIFGTNIPIATLLPEDSRSHEFSNNGEALSISMVQMQRYIDATTQILGAAIASKTAPPESKIIKASYADTRGAEKFIGKQWLKLPGGAIGFFQRTGYPTGMLREANTRISGRYKIRVTGYAFQTEKPVTFAIGATTFLRAADKPTFGYYSFPPGKPTTIEIEAWIENNYMVSVTPFGIYDDNYSIKRIGLKNYKGAGLAIQHVELEGPLTDEFPGRGHRFLFDGLKRNEVEPSNPATRKKEWYVPKFEIASENPATDVAPILHRIASKAFRRPVTAEKVAAYVDLFETEQASGSTFEEALRTATTAIFCSPDFLYLHETKGLLDDYSLASRLSYFLTRSGPDDELLAAAAAGKLRSDPAALQAHAERLMKHKSFDRFVINFTDSWLDLRNMDFTSPDRRLFPEFDPFLQDSMVRETRAYFRELIEKNLGITYLVKSDFSMLNNQLAEHYGIAGVEGPEIRRVSIPKDSVRGGFLSQGSVMKVSANGTNTSPVVRGVWILERILGEVPPPPPAAVPGVEPDIRGATTLREILTKHREAKNCRSCHELIDPPGFAMEGFNPIGGWRERFRSLGEGEKVTELVQGKRVTYKLGLEVDDSGITNDGDKFSDYREFREILAADPDKLAKSLTTKLLAFATGREMGFSDRPEIKEIVKRTGEKGYGMRDIIRFIVTSEIFREK